MLLFFALLLTLTHFACGAPCSKDVQLTEQCTCGSHTCNPSVNEGGTHTGTGPDTQCKSATNTCAAPCSQTDGQTQFNTGNWHDDCTCGTATCAGMPNGSDKYCLASTSTCGGSKVYPACTKDTTLSDKCKCSPGTGSGTAGGPNSPETQNFLGRSICFQEETCEAATNTCSYPQCANTDATAKNQNSCKCGGTMCSSSTYSSAPDYNGFYCNKATNICGVSTDILKYARTVPVAGSTPQLYTKCSDITGNSVIMDEFECFEVVVAINRGLIHHRGFIETSTLYPAGCPVYPHSTGDSHIFNRAPKQFTTDETLSSMLCKIGTSSSQADKISALETTQETCCTKNAALETKLTAVEAKITALESDTKTTMLEAKITALEALLKKNYEGIDKACKVDEESGRRLSSGCGGTSMSNSGSDPTAMSPGTIAAIVIVPIVVLLGCAGGYMYMQQQQSQKIENMPENLYELKNFTSKEATVELFEKHGSMNSNNPLAAGGGASSSAGIVSGTNPMAHVPREQQQQQQQQQQQNELQVNIGSTEELSLPLNWEEVSGADGDANYFWNKETNVTQYERPLH